MLYLVYDEFFDEMVDAIDSEKTAEEMARVMEDQYDSQQKS